MPRRPGCPTRVILVLVLLGLHARAHALRCERGLALRISDAGLRLMAEGLRAALPPAIDLPAMSAVVYDWPLTTADARVELPVVPRAVTIRALEAALVGDVLRLNGAFDVNVQTPLVVVNPYAGFGSAACRADVVLPNLRFTIDLAVGGAGDRVQLTPSNVRVEAAGAGSHAQLSGCDTLQFLAQLVGALKEQTIEQLRGWLERFARQDAARLTEAWLAQATTLTGQVQGVGYSTQLVGSSSAGGALVAEASASFELPAGAGPRCAVAPARPPAAPVCSRAVLPPTDRVGAMYAISISDGLLNQALYTAWSAGTLCLDSASPLFTRWAGSPELLVATLGLPAGTQLAFTVGLAQPPRLDLSVGRGAELRLEGMQLAVSASLPGAQRGSFTVHADASGTARPWIDPASHGLMLALGPVTLSRLAVQPQTGPGLSLDPARVQDFLAQVVVPLFEARLSALPLSPVVVDARRFLLELKQVFVGDGFIALHADAHPMKPALPDNLPPETVLPVPPAPLVGPRLLTLTLGGSDNATPPALLRFETRVDRGAWSGPRFGAQAELALAAGAHLVEARAVDLAGNSDPTPLALTLTVDAVPPTLEITSALEALLTDGGAAVRFRGADDRTPVEALELSAELWRVPDGGGAPELKRAERLPSGAQSVRLAVDGEGVFRLRVIVRDQAGNATSAERGFVVDRGGCALVGGGAGRGTRLALLLLAVLLLGAQRRGRRGGAGHSRTSRADR
ncbi:MAG: hypothetical protein IPG96_07010 [Proteobacteria bacterium]|nr:hypothetical protein [Pseudomonadota bacterium]